jgi:hypothetical protein
MNIARVRSPVCCGQMEEDESFRVFKAKAVSARYYYYSLLNTLHFLSNDRIWHIDYKSRLQT